MRTLNLIVYFPFLFVLGCGGATGNNQVEADSKQAKLLAEVAQLNAKVLDFQSVVEKMRSSQIELWLENVSGPQKSVTFDPQDDRKYLVVKGPAGPVLVMLEKVEPYLDGFTVSLALGNPTSAGYSGLKGTVRWGKKFDFEKSGDYNKLGVKEMDVRDILEPGTWTTVKFNIAPAKPDEVRRIVFEPTFNEIRLRRVNN